MDNPAVEIWASLAKFKLKSLNLYFWLDWIPCPKYIALKLKQPITPSIGTVHKWRYQFFGIFIYIEVGA